jgi:LPXTG-motif cell wall-anchored protein
MRLLQQTIYVFILLACAMSAGAQDAVVKAEVEKNKILLGEPLYMVVEASFPAGKGISLSLPDTIDHFEFLAGPAIDSSVNDGVATVKGMYKMTSFDSGHWVIPSFVLSNGIRSDSIPVDVVFSDFDPAQDYHDIKDIIEVKPPKKKQWWWYVAGGFALLVVLLFYFLRKKKATPPGINAATTVNPYEEAMKQLEELKNSGLGSKQFHTKLVDIFRLYIFRKKGILSLQKTTDDLALQLKSLNLPKEQFDKLSQSLRLSDFVKFAKYEPLQDDSKRSLDDILNIIKIIEQSETKSPL